MWIAQEKGGHTSYEQREERNGARIAPEKQICTDGMTNDEAQQRNCGEQNCDDDSVRGRGGKVGRLQKEGVEGTGPENRKISARNPTVCAPD